MQTASVTGKLTQLTRLRAVNAYLVQEDDGLTLIDTMVAGSADDLLGAAAAAGAPIRRIAFTHAHSDHIGSLDAVKQKLGPDVEVLIPELDVRALEGQRTFDGKKVRGGWPKIETRPDVELKGGERIGSLEVVPSPGHTPGHVAFFDTRDRSLIAGDLFVSIGGLTVTSHFHLQFPLAYLGTWDRGVDLASAKSVRELDPSVIVVGHGGPVRDPSLALARAITRAEQAAH